MSRPGPGPAGATPARRFQPLRDLPVVLWLLTLVVLAPAQALVPAPRWLLIHLVLLGAAGHAILVWSRHFADALLYHRSSAPAWRGQPARLALFNAGVLAVLLGVPWHHWPVTVAGAAGVASAAGWHGASLARQVRRALPARFTSTVRYSVAAACFLPVGATLGALLARDLPDPFDARVRLAHIAVNLLGWVGLTAAGTLVTLWPTMLRTRIAEGSERAARTALPLLVASVVITAGGSLAGLRPVAAAGLLGYLAGLLRLAHGLLDAARRRPPSSFPAWSVAAALLWWAGGLAALAVGVGTSSSWVQAEQRSSAVTPFLAAGFVAQLLLGALSYLVPVVLGGGPSPVRAGNTAFNRAGALRAGVVNLALLVCALPVPGRVRGACAVLVLGGLATFLPVLGAAMRAQRAARAAPPPTAAAVPAPPGRVTGQLGAGLAVVVLAVAAGVAADPAALARSSAGAGSPATGHTTTVAVTARGLRFVPGTVDVPAGDRLVITLTNRDDDVHDLVLDSGADSGRVAPGGSAVLDAGVVGRDLEGWCSVVGHRQLGMVLHVRTTGARTAHGSAEHPAPDRTGTPAAGWTPYPATLPPLPPPPRKPAHRLTFTVDEVLREVTPGVRQRQWVFNGTAPGPVLHGRVGDRFEITLVNRASTGHSIDFHAGALAPDGPMRTIPPGGSLTYRFTAGAAGIWMYHCGTMPMSAHIANGLFGAVVIEPPGLPAVDRSYVLVQSELYLGPQDQPVDVGKLRDERPDAVVFNGYAGQYDHAQLPARAGDRVRIWVLDAGPDRASSFHVVGTWFDTVYAEGAYLLRPGAGGGAQALALQPGQGGFVETTFPEPGHYPFVTHAMVDAERGAHGLFAVAPSTG